MSRKKPSLRTVTTTPAPRAASQSPAPAPSPGGWGGHLHATRVALAMAFEHAAKGNGTLSPNERILTRVCEMRSALACGEWLARFKANGLRELGAARFALNEVGAMSVAAHISDTMAALRRTHLVRRRQMLLTKLERDLTEAGPALDHLIARFAQSLLDAGGRSPESPRTPQLQRARSNRARSAIEPETAYLKFKP
jgi:hypothetical protein